MPKFSRRSALFTSGLGALALVSARARARAAEGKLPASTWAKGYENQRRADLGNGFFLNPILAGDHPDPSILKDGDDYFMTFSSFDAYPGLVVWHSKDLVNWQPLTAALKTNLGSVWAPELCKHEGRYYIYLPAKKPGANSCYVLWASAIQGPWSEPIDLHLPRHIDPGHAVGEDGSRWLFLSGGDRVRLSPDGLSTQGKVEHVYDPWRYPEEWDVESFSPEGPKITRHGEYFYLITAVGGTAGPPTGHMVIAARSRSIHGPWEHCPHNPLVRTADAREKWWSRGHASLIEGPGGDWWSVYHGYENGFWTLGRQTLLDPIEWTADGWFRFRGGDLSEALPKPRGGRAQAHGLALSDDFSSDKIGAQWAFYDPGPNERARVRYEAGALVLEGKGDTPANCSPLTFICGDQAYRCEVEIEVEGDAVGGVLFFYNRRLYCGLGISAASRVQHRQGLERRGAKPAGLGNRFFIRFENNRHIVTFHTSPDGQTWTKYDTQMEVSGYHHNTAYDFLSLRPGIYASGQGRVRFRNFKYQAL